MKRIISLLLILVLFASLASCKKKDEKLTVRFLNFKPEVADVFDDIAKAYEKETGVRLVVDTAANNTYESTLAAKMSTDEAPTIFQVNGPRGYANWKDYCRDLSTTELYKHLSDKSIALTVDGAVYGIPYIVEGYGIIYNEAITDRYFALASRSTEYNSMEEINSFDKLSKLVTDMQAKKGELGIDGVFAVTSLKAGEDWRWQTHLANVPIYYEFLQKRIDLSGDDTKKIDFSYSENYKNLFDLYINNSTTDKGLLGSKLVDESMAEFALGKCAMVQNGNWAWSQISSIKDNTVREDKIKFLPLYMGVDGEQSQGLCIGTENYVCINSRASKEEQKAAEDFLMWLFSSETGKRFVVEELDYIAPFDTFAKDELPTDPLARQVIEWSARNDVDSIPWNFTLFPSQNFKNTFGSALLQYAQGKSEWNDVVKTVTKAWKDESDKL